MTDPAFYLRAGSTEQPAKGTPGNVLTFQSDGKVRGEPPSGGPPLAGLFVSHALAGGDGYTFTATEAGFYELYCGGKSNVLDSSAQMVLTADLVTLEAAWHLGTKQQADFEGNFVINDNMNKMVYLRVDDAVTFTSTDFGQTAQVMVRVYGPLSET